MKLETLAKHWDEFGRRDPLWAILTDPSKRNRGWERAEFFETGEQDVATVFAQMRRLGRVPESNRALDFGCGVGRLTQALAAHGFRRVSGVDISPSMIERARGYNRYGRRCRFFVNDTDDLTRFRSGDFDFVLSLITLQHMDPVYSRRYIREFVRVLAPGGLLVFQIPCESHDSPPPTRVREVDRTLPDEAFESRIEILSAPAGAVQAGVSVCMRLRVVNLSEVPWRTSGDPAGKYQINLGDHWRDADGNLLLLDDVRVPLGVDLLPRQSLEIDFRVEAPIRAGRYIIEFDLVQEGVAWFKDKGATTATATLTVVENIAGTPAATSARTRLAKVGGWLRGRRRDVVSPPKAERTTSEPGSPFFVPVMEMYGLPRDEVLDLLRESGGHIIDVTPDGCGGTEWVTGKHWTSFRYFVTKR